MSEWKRLLKADPTDWLLENDNPSVRYYVLTDLLDVPQSDARVAQARLEVMRSGAVPRILARQADGGYWGVPQDFYIRSKYRGTVWNLIILAQVGADGSDDRIKKACEFILANSQHASGGFAYQSAKNGGGDPDKLLPCLTGNMVWSLLRFGYLGDARVQRGIDWIARYQRFDDGVADPPRGWPYDKLEKCYGRHTCHQGAVKALKALAEIPPSNRTPSANNAIHVGAEYFLQHHILKRSHNLSRVGNKDWLKLGFPQLWKFDILETLTLLLKLGYHDERMQEAVDYVVSRQDERGRWLLDTSFNGRFQASIEQQGKPSKWVTLHALRVLRKYYGRTSGPQTRVV